VLVDAQCTHDGSLKHLQMIWNLSTTGVVSRGDDGEPADLLEDALQQVDSRQQSGAWKRKSPESNGCHLSQETVLATVDLQKRLVLNGFRMLQPGGRMVYSTCSFTRVQNEGVVEWLLSLPQWHSPESREKPVPIVSNTLKCMPCREVVHPDSGLVAYRFDPWTSQTSGLFVSVIEKRPVAGGSEPPKLQ